MAAVTQKEMREERKEILTALDQDPKAQECLKLYQNLPDAEKKSMLQSMDSFLRGFSEGLKAAT